MRLFRFFKLSLVFLLFFSCTDTNEPVTKMFTNRISNQTDTSFIFKIEDVSGNVILNEVIETNNTLDFCEYKGENYAGIGCSDFGTITILFNSNRGYICSSTNDNSLCIPQKDLITDKVGTEIENNIYEIVITQEDFNNAHDLPAVEE